MIYIDKQQNIADGEGYTRDYLESSFDEGSHTFLPSLKEEASFNCFRNQQYISHSPHADADFKSLLVREQQGLCSYCMRRISPDARDSNIEHLVPKKSLVADFPYYARYSDLFIFQRRNTNYLIHLKSRGSNLFPKQSYLYQKCIIQIQDSNGFLIFSICILCHHHTSGGIEILAFYLTNNWQRWDCNVPSCTIAMMVIRTRCHKILVCHHVWQPCLPSDSPFIRIAPVLKSL